MCNDIWVGKFFVVGHCFVHCKMVSVPLASTYRCQRHFDAFVLATRNLLAIAQCPLEEVGYHGWRTKWRPLCLFSPTSLQIICCMLKNKTKQKTRVNFCSIEMVTLFQGLSIFCCNEKKKNFFWRSYLYWFFSSV